MIKPLQFFWYRFRYQSPYRILDNSARCLICTDLLRSVGKGKIVCTCGNLEIWGGDKRLGRTFQTDLWAENSKTERVQG